MQARIKSPVYTFPGTLEAMQLIGRATEVAGIPRSTAELVNVRVAQLNGCSVCVDLHSRSLKKLGEPDPRVFAIAAWREAPYYTEPERAALDLAECTTRMCDRPDPVSDEVWKEASRHFDERQLGALVLAIGVANLWNRLNVTTRQPSGEWVAQFS